MSIIDPQISRPSVATTNGTRQQLKEKLTDSSTHHASQRNTKGSEDSRVRVVIVGEEDEVENVGDSCDYEVGEGGAPEDLVEFGLGATIGLIAPFTSAGVEVGNEALVGDDDDNDVEYGSTLG